MNSASVKLLICALGGEGGGVLADWITQAAVAEGLVVSRTSVPGVAQRTGATSYYVEIAAQPDVAPVMALYPAPGRLDVVIASEWVEAARAMLRGFVTPDRTLLISSTHRVFTISERSAPDDGRFDSARVEVAAKSVAKRLIAADFAQAATLSGARLNAVLLGALAASGAVPIADASFRAAIGEGPNQAGFRAGQAIVVENASPSPARPTLRPPPTVPPAFADAWSALPAAAQNNAAFGLARLMRYQDASLGRLYLKRISRISEVSRDARLTASVAACTALLMSPDDVVQVAREKVRPERIAALRQEAGAAPGEPIRVVEYLKPGLEELAALLPARLGRALSERLARSSWLRSLALPLRITSTALVGGALLRALAALRPLRPVSFGARRRLELVDRWLERVTKMATLAPEAALELAEAPRIVKGYAETLARTTRAFELVVASVADPILYGEIDLRYAPDALLQARLAAQKDDGGRALEALIAALPRGQRIALAEA